MQCPANIQLDSPDGGPVSVTYSLPDATGGTPPYQVTCTPPSGTALGLGTSTVTCNVVDRTGRSAICSFTVTVIQPPRLALSRFLAFGDSLTEGYIFETLTARLIDVPNSYPARLDRLLRAHFRGQSLIVMNDGHGGERISQPYPVTGSPGGRVRLPLSLDANRPEVLLLMEGTNDLMADVQDEAVEGLRKMIEETQSRGIRIFLATIPPMKEGGPKGIAAEVVAAVPVFNSRVRTLAATHGAVLVDVYDVLKDRPELLGPDNLHLTSQGYEVVAQTFFDAIKRELEMRTATR